MKLQFRTKIFLSIALILILALTAMFLASTATVQKPLTQYIDSELDRVYRNLEQAQALRIEGLITQGLLISEKPDLWNAVQSLTVDPSQFGEADSLSDPVPSPEAYRLQAVRTIEDTLDTISRTYGDLFTPDFLLVIQTDGIIRVSRGNGPRTEEDASRYSFWQLINHPDKWRSTAFVYENRLYHTTLEPIDLDNERVGYISLGYQVDAETLGASMPSLKPSDSSKRTSGIREVYVVFLSPDKRIFASTVPAAMADSFHDALLGRFEPPAAGTKTNIPLDFRCQGEEITGQFWPVREEATSRVIGYEAVLTSKTQALSVLTELRFDFLFISLMALLLSGIVGYFVSRSVTRPVDQLVFAAQQLTAGNLEHRIRYEVRDELGVLADAFEHMRLSLLRRLQELADLNASLERKVQERTAELRQALDNLKQAESHLVLSEKMVALGQMVAGIAHEINNPLNYIRNGIKPLKRAVEDLQKLIDVYDGCRLDPDDRETVERLKRELDLTALREDIEDLSGAIQDGAERTLQIVGDLRTFSRKDETAVQLTDLREGIESSLNILRHERRDRVEVLREYGDLPPVLCNPGRINQVFLNLLGNALQAIDGPGRITVRTERRGSEAVVSIRDTGSGIPPENLPKIFEPFFTTKDVGKGTGLGLSISYGIVQRHGGRIEVSSAVGQGTEFRVVLPLSGPVRNRPEDADRPRLFIAPSVE